MTSVENVNIIGITPTSSNNLNSFSSISVVSKLLFPVVEYPGWNVSTLVDTKSNLIQNAVSSNTFTQLLRSNAVVNNATQLLFSNVSNAKIASVTLVNPNLRSSSSSDSSSPLSVGIISGLTLGILFGTILLLFVLYVCIRVKRSQSNDMKDVTSPQQPHESAIVKSEENFI